MNLFSLFFFFFPPQLLHSSNTQGVKGEHELHFSFKDRYTVKPGDSTSLVSAPPPALVLIDFSNIFLSNNRL